MAPLPLTYVVPLRAADLDGWAGLAAYLRWLAPHVDELLVVDGSDAELYERHLADSGGRWRQIPPDPGYDFAMGKVNGVTTGVLAARSELVVLADDDVRYDRPTLERVCGLLGDAELVRPQNHFSADRGRLPWHAVLDTGRTLLNRVWTGDREFPVGDFPGTLGVRRSAFLAAGGYDGDVIFENLELMRTITGRRGRVVSPLDLYVRRLPPTTAHFRSQRVRQAYDDFAIPLRMAVWLAVVPGAVAALATGRWRALAGVTAAIAGAAESGRRRAGGRTRFPAAASLLSPVWTAERGVSAWLAVWRRLTLGGIPYAGRIVPRAASSPRALRAAPGARKPISLCVPSQKGSDRDLPQRQSATAGRSTGISVPSGAITAEAPRTR